LANGLVVLAVPEPAAATVAVQLWYRVGAKNDPVGRSGFAHLFEHLMFKSTRYMKSETFDRLTEDVGGQNNAYTSEDVTVYQNEVPANHLERLLWAEAERLSNLQVDQANFDSERLVVKEELRQRVLADPYGRFFESLVTLNYEKHPYQRPVIGSIEDLDRATLEEVRNFHSTWYRSDNAVLVVAGGFEPAQLDVWVDRYFAGLVRPSAALPRVNIVEPPRRADKRVQLRAPNVPLPAVALLWKGPALNHADAPALRIASALLSAGDSSRLNEVLVYQKQWAQQAGFSADLSAEAGMLTAYAISAAGASLARIERGLIAEIERLARGPISAAKLDKVRTQWVTGNLARRQTPAGQAAAVAQALVLNGDVRYAERELPMLLAVTAADVQRVLKRHVLTQRRVSLHYSAEAKLSKASP
jgi:zinc protease